jgi:hypothetical protein
MEQDIVITPSPKSELETWREQRAKGPALAEPVETPEIEAEADPPTPVDTAKPAEKPVETPQVPDEDDDGDEAERSKHDPRRVSKRQAYINDLIRQQTRAELRAEQLERELAALRSPKTPDAPAAVQYTRPKPTEDEIGSRYRTHADFVEDLAEWKWEQREVSRARAEAQTKHQTEYQTEIAAYEKRTIDARTRYADFDEKVTTPLPTPLTATIGDFLLSSEHGPDLAYYLATHHDDYRRISALSQGRAWAELGKLETSVASKLSEPKTPPAPPVTKAPAPIPPIASGAITPTKSLDELAKTAALADWRKARRADSGRT